MSDRRAPATPAGPSGYVELHCHSVFSLMDGAASPEALVARAAALGHPALALTDHDDLGGVVRFAQAAEEHGIGGVVGVELTVNLEVGGGRWAVAEEPYPAPPTAHRPPGSSHLVLLAESRVGYGNLATLVTRARLGGGAAARGRPVVDLDTLARHASGVFCLTGCPRGRVPALVAAGDVAGAHAAARTLHDVFDGRMAVEVWDHHLPEERAIVRELKPIARALGVPWVVTNDVHYATAPGRIVHDVLTALRHERTLDEMGTRLRPSGDWYLKSAAQMRRRWREDDAGLRATLAIAERCAFRLKDLRPTLPRFPLPPGVTADEHLRALVWQGAYERWGEHAGSSGLPAAHVAQLEHELALVARLGLAGYFLIVWDIVRFARREGILCQGRGSAANSAVCYCLGITAVDPIRMNLLFERFLSEERQEAPDIDIDFAHRERERVIQYVYERYGREHAAMVCEHITWRGRSAVRDAARVLGFSPQQGEALSSISDRFSAKATAERLRVQSTEHRAEGRNASPDDPNSEDAPVDADALLAESASQDMVRGTEATTRLREVRAQARARHRSSVRADGDGPAATAGDTDVGGGPPPRRLTSSDRPQPNAPWEPYGSPNAQQVRHDALGTPHWVDPHANDDHVERRNPTTALGPSTDPAAELLARAGLDPADGRVRALAGIVAGLHDVPRHRSIHVGGFVLTEEPLGTVVPIEPASMPGRTVIQWEKDDLDPVGLVKIDLLGLGMLTLLQDCLLYIRQTRGVTIDLATLDMTDQAVYDDLCRADTIGVFQVESRAQMNTLPRLKPRCFYDLVVEVALIRPGPIQGDMVHPYLRRRAGVEEVTYPHPSLEPILRRTLGVPLFQEQGMQVAIACAGFTPGEADLLRRAMGHKRSRERMADICQKMVDGMRANGIPEETATRIYNQINAFADYGFPESHAASFALLVYASAYLKHYYAPEFTAAILNAQPMGFYSVGTLIEDARRHGVVVRPVDVTRSAWDATLELPGLGTRDSGQDMGDRGRTEASSRRQGSARPVPSSQPRVPASRPQSRVPAVRLGLRSITGLGPAARDAFEQARARGPFTSLEDVVRRTRLDRRALRTLAESGALDALVADEPDPRRRRRVALWRVLAAERGDAGPLAPAHEEQGPPPVPALLPFELTAADYKLTGLSLAGHPMAHLREHLAPNGVRTARDLLTRGRDGEAVGFAGLVICRQRPGTAKGFVFLSLEDETGIVNVVVTPQRFERQALLISRTPLLLVRGVLQVESRVVNIRARSFRALEAPVGAEHARSHDFH